MALYKSVHYCYYYCYYYLRQRASDLPACVNTALGARGIRLLAGVRTFAPRTSASPGYS